MTIHVDGGSRGNPGPAACGISIARDGKPILEVGLFLGRMTNNQAEYHAVIRALAFAGEIDKGEDIEVIGDSELVVKQISGEYRVKNAQLADLLQDVHKAIWKFDFAPTFRHTKRANNKRADELANLAMDAGQDIVETNETDIAFEGVEPLTADTQEDDLLDHEPAETAASPMKTGGGIAAEEAIVVVECTQAPIKNGCPAGCQEGDRWPFADVVPGGFCLRAATSVGQTVSAMLETNIPADEEPEDFAAVDVRCPRPKCRAIFSANYTADAKEKMGRG